MGPQEWLPEWTTRGDLAAAAVGYAVGFAVDVFLFPTGVPPGTTAGVFAVGSVGLKNSAQGAVERFKQKKQAQLARLDLEERAEIFHQVLAQQELGTAAEKLARDLDLWRRGVLGDDDLQKILSKMISDYREREVGGHDSPPTGTSGRFQTLEVDEEAG